jgi:hypothetical protein
MGLLNVVQRLIVFNRHRRESQDCRAFAAANATRRFTETPYNS